MVVPARDDAPEQARPLPGPAATQGGPHGQVEVPLDHGPEPMAEPVAPPVAPPVQTRAVEGPEGVLGQGHLLRVMAHEPSGRATRPRRPNRPLPVQVRRVDLASEGATPPLEGTPSDAVAAQMVRGSMRETAPYAPEPWPRTRTATGEQGVRNAATAPTRDLDAVATGLPSAAQDGAPIASLQPGPRGPFVPFLAA